MSLKHLVKAFYWKREVSPRTLNTARFVLRTNSSKMIHKCQCAIWAQGQTCLKWFTQFQWSVWSPWTSILYKTTTKDDENSFVCLFCKSYLVESFSTKSMFVCIGIPYTHFLLVEIAEFYVPEIVFMCVYDLFDLNLLSGQIINTFYIGKGNINVWGFYKSLSSLTKVNVTTVFKSIFWKYSHKEYTDAPIHTQSACLCADQLKPGCEQRCAR